MLGATGFNNETPAANRWIPALSAVLVLSLAPVHAARGEGAADPRLLAPLLQQICLDLVDARHDLRHGALDERGFADRVLDLFTRAESLQVALATAPGIFHKTGSGFAMGRALRYLVESLRENYVGIVARDGVRFVGADRALEAAVAWRSNVDAIPQRGKR